MKVLANWSAENVCVNGMHKWVLIRLTTVNIILQIFNALINPAFTFNCRPKARLAAATAPGVNFINVFTCSFYTHRSQKRKKLLNLTVCYAFLGSLRVKAVCRMLVKLTPADDVKCPCRVQTLLRFGKKEEFQKESEWQSQFLLQ